MARGQWNAWRNTPVDGLLVGVDMPHTLDENESHMQTRIFNRAHNIMAHGRPLSTYLHHSPNGGERVKKVNSKGGTYCPEVQKMKSMGTKSGWPDLECTLACGGYTGFYIELKYGKGRVSPEQIRRHRELRQVGRKVMVCYSSRSALEALIEYVSQPLTIPMLSDAELDQVEGDET